MKNKLVLAGLLCFLSQGALANEASMVSRFLSKVTPTWGMKTKVVTGAAVLALVCYGVYRYTTKAKSPKIAR